MNANYIRTFSYSGTPYHKFVGKIWPMASGYFVFLIKSGQIFLILHVWSKNRLPHSKSSSMKISANEYAGSRTHSDIISLKHEKLKNKSYIHNARQFKIVSVIANVVHKA